MQVGHSLANGQLPAGPTATPATSSTLRSHAKVRPFRPGISFNKLIFSKYHCLVTTPTTCLTHQPNTPIWIVFSSKSVCANETLINNALDHQFSFQQVFHAITLAPNLFLVHVYSVKVRSEVLRCAPILFSNFELQLFDSFDQASQIVRSVPLPVVFEPDSIDPFAPILPTHRTSLLGPHPSTKKLPQDLSHLHTKIQHIVSCVDSTAAASVDRNAIDGLGHVCRSSGSASRQVSSHPFSREKTRRCRRPHRTPPRPA